MTTWFKSINTPLAVQAVSLLRRITRDSNVVYTDELRETLEKIMRLRYTQETYIDIDDSL